MEVRRSQVLVSRHRVISCDDVLTRLLPNAPDRYRAIIATAAGAGCVGEKPLDSAWMLSTLRLDGYGSSGLWWSQRTHSVSAVSEERGGASYHPAVPVANRDHHPAPRHALMRG